MTANDWKCRGTLIRMCPWQFFWHVWYVQFSGEFSENCSRYFPRSLPPTNLSDQKTAGVISLDVLHISQNHSPPCSVKKDNDEQFNDFSWAIIIMRFSTHFALGFCWFDQSFANYLNLREVGFSLKMHYDEQQKKVFSFFQLNAITFTLRYLNWLMHPHLCTLCQLNAITLTLRYLLISVPTFMHIMPIQCNYLL